MWYKNISAHRNFFPGGGARSTKGGLVRGIAAWGVRGGGGGGAGVSPRTPEKFSKNLKKPMKNLQFFENFQGTCGIFSNFLKILSNESRKFGQKFRNMHL